MKTEHGNNLGFNSCKITDSECFGTQTVFDSRSLADEKGFSVLAGVLIGYFGAEQSVTVPTGVVSIGRGAFSGRDSLRKITLPEGLKIISDYAFYHCEGLQSVYLPDGVTCIGENAFEACRNLQVIRIPESLTMIGNDAFRDCCRLEMVRGNLNIFHSTQMKIRSLETYLHNAQWWEEDKKSDTMKKLFCKMRRYLMGAVLSEDNVMAMYIFDECHAIRKSNVDEKFLEPAIAANATSCIAFLLDWKDRHFTKKDRQRQFEWKL